MTNLLRRDDNKIWPHMYIAAICGNNTIWRWNLWIWKNYFLTKRIKEKERQEEREKESGKEGEKEKGEEEEKKEKEEREQGKWLGTTFEEIKELLKFEDGNDEAYEEADGYGQGENDGTAAIRFELLWRDYMRLCTAKFGSKLFKLSGFTHAQGGNYD